MTGITSVPGARPRRVSLARLGPVGSGSAEMSLRMSPPEARMVSVTAGRQVLIERRGGQSCAASKGVMRSVRRRYSACRPSSMCRAIEP